MEPTLDSLFPGTGPVLLDGAMGTSLHMSGWPGDRATVLANLEAPGLVSSTHAAFRRAGARVLLANTFGALICGDKRVLEAVAAGVRIARKAAGQPTASGGHVSPTTSGIWRLTPPPRVAGNLATAPPAERTGQVSDLVRAFVDHGVDILVFETCNSRADAERIVEVADKHAPDLPCVLCATTTDGGREDHKRVHDVIGFVQGLRDIRWTAGLNCGNGPSEALRLGLSCPEMPRWMKPNNGLPREPVDDNVMAAFARAARQQGVRWVGGCCGTTAETLTAMAAALDALS